MNRAGRSRVFLATWTAAVIASSCAFIVHLALRSRTMSLGYDLGRVRTEQQQLREVRRVLELESASYKTPERVEVVARTLLGMEPAPSDRTIVIQLPHDELASGVRPGKSAKSP